MALTFLNSDLKESFNYSYPSLLRQARAIAAELQTRSKPGARALLLCPSGASFVGAFLGCLLAGVVAVPAYPPRLRRHLGRLRSIVRDAAPDLILSDHATRELSEAWFAEEIRNAPLPAWIDTDEIDPGLADRYRERFPQAEEIAFLQYTSGSTGDPKGVVVRHGNLAHNLELIRATFEQDQESIVVGWLPLYHDMGLIGNLLQPLWVGGRCFLMPPSAFLQRPLRWLEAITRFRATTSGGPNFAFDLCSRRIAAADRERLDLTSWRVAFNGAEPIRAETLERFASTFDSCGFRRGAFRPCYGLAEATLLVAGVRRPEDPLFLDFEAEALERGFARPGVKDGRRLARLVACGRIADGHRVRIADPATDRPMPPEAIGEIRIGGPSVTSGYFGRPEASPELFATPSDDPISAGTAFLRTGDLGFIHAGQLFVTGRSKDLIIVRGRNLHPQDLEHAALSCNPAVRGAAAFALAGEGGESVALVAELEPRSAPDLEALAQAVRRAVAAAAEVEIQALGLVRAGDLPRTSSGKVRRRACRNAFLDGSLPLLARSDLAPPLKRREIEAPDVEMLCAMPAEARVEPIARHLRELVGATLSVSPDALDSGTPLLELGLDSIATVEMQARLSEHLGLDLDLSELLAASLSEIAERLARSLEVRETGGRPAISSSGDPEGLDPLTEGQQTLWFLHRLDPGTTAHHVAVAARVRGTLDLPALVRALDLLARRHRSLSSRIVSRAGEPHFAGLATPRGLLEEISVSGGDETGASDALARRVAAPFDLDQGPLARLLIAHSEGGADRIAWVADHLAIDFWSVSLVLEELEALYAAELAGRVADLPTAPVQVGEIARLQAERLAGPIGERLEDFWRRELADAPPAATLFPDRAGGASARAGAELSLRIEGADHEALRRTAAALRTTPFALALGALQVLLRRYGAPGRFLVGAPFSGRTLPGSERTVGYLMNPLPLRADLEDDPPYRQAIARAGRSAFAAFDHQEYPAARIAHGVRPGAEAARGDALFRVLLTFNRKPGSQRDDLAAFLAGDEGAAWPFGNTLLEPLPLAPFAPAFDLHWTLNETATALSGRLAYDAGRYDRTTMARAVAVYLRLLALAAERPEAAIEELPLLGEVERREILLWGTGSEATCEPIAVERRFAAAAARHPERIALECGDVRWSYRELGRRAASVARALLDARIGLEDRVALFAERSPETIAGLLGILAAGAAYVPLEPKLPDERLRRILDDSGARLALASADAASRLPTGVPRLEPGAPGPDDLAPELPARRCDPSHLAYVLYTSGSTGRPKGVAISRGSLAAYTETAIAMFEIGAEDRVLQFASLAFDTSAEEIFPTLGAGATLCLRDEAMIASPARFFAACADRRISVLDLPTSFWHELALAEGPIPEPLRLVVIGGEKALAEPAARWRRRAPRARLVNTYGPTEATIVATGADLGDPTRLFDSGTPPLGSPVRGVRAYPLGRFLDPLPAGAPGEICLAGSGLARGYLGAPAATAERFVPDPFSPLPGSRLYRTGDLGRHLPDGNLQYLGRIDHQVKIRGQRTELGEIEAVLATHPGVREAAVLAIEAAPGDLQLAAFVAASPLASITDGELRGYLRARLPGYMVPASVVVAPDLPRTPSDKLDRRALVELVPAAGTRRAIEPPRTPVEELLAGICAEVLGHGQIGVDEDLFELGCHSLLAIQIVGRAATALGRELPLANLFEAPTVRALALLAEAAGDTDAGFSLPPLGRAPRDRPIPLSFPQERLWFLQQLNPESASYFVPRALRMRGRLERAALEGALGEIVRRHEILRTSFPPLEGRPVQRIHPARPIRVPTIDLARITSASGDRELDRLIFVQGRAPFDLDSGPLLRWSLVRFSAEDHALIQTEHHLVHDGWTQTLLVREFLTLYRAIVRGEASPFAELPYQFADFAAWQRSAIHGETLERLLGHWRGALAGMPPLLPLPTDKPRPAVQRHHGAQITFEIAPALADAVRAAGRRCGATLFMATLGAFAALLRRATGTEDLPIGTGVANRRLREIENMIGMVINTLVLRIDSAGDPSFEELLARVRSTCLAAYQHQDVPFERLVDALQPERSLAYTPLIQVFFAFMDAPMPTLELPGLEIEALDVHNRSAKFDLNVTVIPHREQRAGDERGAARGDVTFLWEYNTDLFEHATMKRLIGHYLRLLEAFATDAGTPILEAPILGAWERHQLLFEIDPPRVEATTEGGLWRAFARVAATRRDAVAVTFRDRQLTYGELAVRAERLAATLAARGVGPEAPVGLFAERTLELPIAILGVLCANACYVPLDADAPPDRIDSIARDAGLAAFLPLGRSIPDSLADRSVDLADTIAPAGASSSPPRAVDLAHLAAYVIYTSGSTGRPKGVVIGHGQVLRLFRSTAAWFEPGAEDVWSLFHSPAFDFSVWELWGALLYGGRVVLVPKETTRSPEAFHLLLREQRVTRLSQTPSAFVHLIGVAERSDDADLALRTVVFGGEALEPRSLAPWTARHGWRRPRLINMYGITETTVHVTYRELDARDLEAAGSAIGRPIPDQTFRIADERLSPSPLGIPGEILVGGAGGARGYLGRPELTAERFLPDPWSPQPGDRLYRSGDLGRRRTDGEVEYLGRIDHQAKIRGFRIEPGEIEAALAAHPAVREAVVLVEEHAPGDRRLVAFLLADGLLPTADGLRDALATRLPDYMMPASFVEVERFPLTVNGKIDRRALLEQAHTGRIERIGSATPYSPPRSDLERVLVEAFVEVLGVDRVGLDDNFFSLGGDSLLTLRLRTVAGRRGALFPLEELFRHQTIRHLAAALGDRPDDATPSMPAPFALLSPEALRALPAGLTDAYPLAALQAGMIFHSELTPGSTRYHNVSRARMAAPFDARKLAAAIALATARHAVLRTTFQSTGLDEPVQLVHRSVATRFAVIDLAGLAEPYQRQAIRAWFEAEKRAKFSLDQAPLCRFAALPLKEGLFEFGWVEHHAILDGWSVALLMEELFASYVRLLRGEVPIAEPPPPPYVGFIALERAAVAGDQDWNFWFRSLEDSAPIELFPEREERSKAEAVRLQRSSHSLAGESLDRLAGAARTHGLPFKSLLLAAHARVIAFWSGRSEAATGLVVNGRPDQAGADRTLGLFLNTVPVRWRLRAGSWLNLAHRAFAIETESLPHRRFPMAEIRRRLGGAPLFDVAFNYVHFHPLKSLAALPGIELIDEESFAETDFPLSLTFVRDPWSEDLRLLFEYHPGRVDRTDVARLAAFHLRALDRMAENPAAPWDAPPLLALEETRQLLDLGGIAAPPEARTIPDLVGRWALETPDSIALTDQGAHLSYGALDLWSDRAAAELEDLGVRPERVVASLWPRSAEAILAMLGIWKAGGIYLPIDAEYPPERCRLQAEESRVHAVVGRPQDLARHQGWIEAVGARPLDLGTLRRGAAPKGPRMDLPRALAYAIYTSGSTGRPKAVAIPHDEAAAYFPTLAERVGLRPGERALQFCALTFDYSLEEIYCALAAGATLIVRGAGVWSADDLGRAIERERLTMVSLPTSFFRAWLQGASGGGDTGMLRQVVVGGEAMEAALGDLFLARRGALGSPRLSLLNGYGPTEATITATAYVLGSEAPKPVPIGRSLRGRSLRIATPDGELVPTGIAGELLLAGRLARGYLGRPDLTAAAFVPDPWSQTPGERLYRTGDQARFRADGEVEFLGRADHQVKVRGFRIELGEIEANLLQLPGVSGAVVVQSGPESLFAALTPASLDLGSLAERLHRRLPGHMVPNGFVALDSLPLTPTGKIDRHAVARLRPTVSSAIEEAPATPAEEIIAGTFAELLGRARVGVREDFFGLGGHSLLATRAVSRLREIFGVEIAIADLFAHPRARDLAQRLDTRNEPTTPPIRPRAEAGPAPLSYAQERLWFLDQLEGGSATYNLPAAVALDGSLRRTALAAALTEIVRRHEVLRTALRGGPDGPYQEAEPAAVIPLPYADLSALGEPRRGGEAERISAAEAWRPFSLDRAPLLRALLVRLAPNRHVALVVVHHAASDGWSMVLLIREVGALYGAFVENRPTPLPPLAIQYADYAVEQRNRLGRRETLEPLLAWWRTALAEVPEVLPLPIDHPRSGIARYRGATEPVLLPASVVDALEAFARRAGATLFMALLAAFQALLGRLADRERLAIGTPIAGRQQAEIEPLIGFFVNLLALPGDLSGNPSFAELTARARAVCLGAYAHQELPFERLVEELAPHRDLSRAPIVQAMLTLQNLPTEELSAPGLAFRAWPLPVRVAKLDLELLLEPTPAGLEGRFEFDRDLFDAATVARLARRLEAWLRTALDSAHRPVADLLPLLPEESEELARGRDTAAPFSRAPFDLRFRREAAVRPHSIAATAGQRHQTYAELDAAADRIAHGVAALGVGPDQLVVLFADRGLDFLAAVLGILRAGAAWVPVDPDLPAKRLRALFEQTRNAAVIAARRHLPRLAAIGGLPSVVAIEDLLAIPAPAMATIEAAPESLAYAIFTSGSTGVPKGALVTRLGMLNHLDAKRLDLGLGPSDVIAQNAPQSFDISVWQMLAALPAGGRMHAIDPSSAADPRRLFDEVESGGVTVLEVVPSMLRALLDEAAHGGARTLAGLRLLIATGEALAPDLCVEWLARFPGIPIVNAYGPTECSDDVTHQWIDRPERAGRGSAAAPIGRALANVQLYVLDRSAGERPPGTEGELAVGGIAVGRGYLDDPQKTALAFRPDPFGTLPGGRLYRTGDLARIRDGEFHFLGRIDHQVKLRGFRIELGEIEAAIAGRPEVAGAVVVALDGLGGGRELAAYLVAAPGRAIDTEALSTHLAASLPQYMVPSSWTVLESFPLSANGKLDRARLPVPQRAQAVRRRAPSGTTEETLAAIWSQVLGHADIAAADDFFDLGGHSLLATRILVRLRAAFGVELPLQALFTHSTLAGLAEAVEAARRSSVELLPAPGRAAGPPVLSLAQRRFWLLEQLEPGNAAYHVVGSFELRGLLDERALAGAFRAAIERHESLRSRFDNPAGEPLLRFDAGVPHLAAIDLSARPAREAEIEARRAAERLASRPFDLRGGPLVRGAAFRLTPERTAVVFALHHIVGDGWSLSILARDLSAFYALAGHREPGAPAPKPSEALGLTYSDFAAWQQQVLTGAFLARQIEYWRDRLAGLPPLLSLPLDRPRPPFQSYRGGERRFAVPAPLSARLTALARRFGASQFQLLLAAFRALLGRVAGETDVAIGIPTSGRVQAAFEGLVGPFVNTLVIRTQIAETARFPDLVAAVRQSALAADAHQWVPFERLVEELRPARQLEHSVLFQTFFAFDVEPDWLPLPDLEVVPFEVRNRNTQFDLQMAIGRQGESFAGHLLFNSDLFDPATAERFVRRFRALLKIVAEQPDIEVATPLLAGCEERHQLLIEWNDTASRSGGGLVHRQFERRARERPDRIAVECGGKTLSYRELDGAASAVARRLALGGVAPEERIGVLVERGLELPVALLGVLKAGAAYVPLDPTYPEERIALVLEDAQIVRLLVGGGAAPPAGFAGAAIPVAIEPDAPAMPGAEGSDAGLAYVLYTSGSTGRAKGVAVTHGSFSRFLAAMAKEPGLDEHDALLAVTSPSFDISGLELFLPLLEGGRVVIADPQAVQEPARLVAEWRRSGATVMQATPATWTLALEAGWPADRPGRALVGGEALPLALARTLAARATAAWNLYGPTETTIWSSAVRLEEGLDGISVGRPIEGTAAYVLDSSLDSAPLGSFGELYLGGVGLARGYLGRPDLTGGSFLPDPFRPGERMYRTGDLGRFLPDGRLELAGRGDHQVKIRGYRIEPGEVESALTRHPGVSEAVVVALGDAPDRRRLVGYYTARNGSIDTAELRNFVAERLPGYMVPSQLVALAALPRTPNGKVDRRALPAPEGERRPAEALAPRNEIERRLAAIWCVELALDRVGIEDNFFDLGGQSLLLARVHARLVEEYPGAAIRLIELFQFPTIAALAERLSVGAEDDAEAVLDDEIERRRRGREAQRGGSTGRRRAAAAERSGHE